MEYFAFKARLVLILDRGGWYIPVFDSFETIKLQKP